ncbi:hypothetical protein SSX86_024569 [Deinandra increscens subsp. villosa]|uniref:Zinc finger PHD-type domain-containing protein n=1 Tax=Deinandra increscens subsp. villosa TaxID=3103831 RepID=A0AAP0CNK0_9ASTR
MASSDNDEEILPEVVSNYYFYDEEDEPVPFTDLPVQWSNGHESSDDSNNKIYLRGKIDNGLQRVHKQVKAWKFEFLKGNPEISVLSKDNNWIKLQTPRKSYENTIRTILITVHCLHFLWRKPKASSKALRDHLFDVFSLYDIRPSENDLKDHVNFIREAVKRDKTLQKSKFLASLLEGRSRKMRAFDQNAEAFMKPSFIVDDKVFEYEDYDDNDDDYDVDDVEDDIFDTVCAICDNGGDLTCCEGKCFRAFHATVKSARSAKSSCKSLGLQSEEVKGSQPFVCLNCSHEQHQCFACGKLGSSNKSFAEVFCCSSETCGHFYHPDCVAKLLEDESDTEARNLEEKIGSGEPFICPAHRCHKCKKGEDEKVKGLQFAVCRRCPRSYHRKCLPSKIVFYNKDNDEDVIARAWNDLLPKSRALIYCLKHKMDQELGTAVRNIKFPEMTVEEDVVNSDHISDERSVEEPVPSVRQVDSSIKQAEISSGPERVEKQRFSVTYNKKPLKRNLSIDTEKDHIAVDADEQTPIVVENDNFPSLDTKSRDRIKSLMKDVESHITLDMVKRHYSNTCIGAAFGRLYNKTRKLDAVKQGYDEEDHMESRRYGIGSLSQRTRWYVKGHRYSGVSSHYHLAVAEPSSCNRSSAFAMNRYIPRLDELNYTWMKNMEMGVYDHPIGPHMDASSFDPGPYHPSPRRDLHRPGSHHSLRHSFPHHNQHRPLPHHNPQHSYSHHNQHRYLPRHNPYYPYSHRNPHRSFSHDSWPMNDWMYK